MIRPESKKPLVAMSSLDLIDFENRPDSFDAQAEWVHLAERVFGTS